MRIAALTIAFALVLISLATAQSGLQEGQRFLKENATKPGVNTTPSGLQYKVLKEGPAKARRLLTSSSSITAARLSTVKSSTAPTKSGKPIEFPLNRVIPGWTEGVQLMKEGAKCEFFIPPNLAYGSRGAGGVIGPDETLIFEVELLKVR